VEYQYGTLVEILNLLALHKRVMTLMLCS
jgi:hypothetical protein